MKIIFIPPWYLSSALLFITSCAIAPSLPLILGASTSHVCFALTIPPNPLDVLQPESISRACGAAIIYMEFSQVAVVEMTPKILESLFSQPCD